MTGLDPAAKAKVARAELFKRVLISITAVFVTATLVVMVAVLLHVARTAELIEDCTNPAGECAKRGAAQTGSAVASINEVQVLAVVCAVGVDPALPFRKRLDLVNGCVSDALALREAS